MDENKKQKLLLVTLIVLIVVLLGLFCVIYNQIQNARELVATDEASVTVTATKTLQNVSVSYDLGSPSAVEDLDSAKDVANRFMLAKENRSLDEAKPFMSEELFNSTTPEEFAGSSSPSMDRFEIISAEVGAKTDTYEVVVKSYWLLQGEDADQIEYKLTIYKLNDEFLVNLFEEISRG